MTRRRRWLIALGCAMLLIAAAVWVALSVAVPAIIRREIAASLRAAGFENVQFELVRATPWRTLVRTVSTGENGRLSIGEAAIRYSPLDAINGHIESIVIRDGRLVIPLALDQASPTTATTASPSASTRPSGAPLPVQSIRAESCTLVLQQGDAQVELNFDASLVQSANAASALEAAASIGEGSIQIRGEMNFPSQHFQVDAAATELPLGQVVKLIPADQRGAIADLSGAANVKCAFTFAGGDMSVDAVVNAPQIKIAGQDMSDVHLAVANRPDGTRLSDVRFTWAGGKFSAEPITLAPGSDDVALVLSAEKVDLNQALQIVLQGRVSGTGTLSGRLPVSIKLDQVSFGQGSVHSDGPGTLKLSGALGSIAEVLDQSDPAFKTDRDKQAVKQQVLEAMQDFRYDSLSAVFIPGEKGLVVSVNLQGQGRVGAKQSLDITLNFYGFERGLNTYLAGRSRVLELSR
jgi:hypothetical protein